MIRSMTGFGKGTVKCSYGKITVEIKTLNHKSLSITCSPFNGLFFLEERIEKLLDRKIFRGKIFIRITRESLAGEKPLRKIEVNEELAREYIKKIKKVQKKLGVKGEIQIQEMIGFPGVLESSTEKQEEKIWPHMRKAFQKALDATIDYRKKEGRRLAKDLNSRITKIKQNIRVIKRYEKQGVKEYRKKLFGSFREITNNAEPDKNRLEAEVALFARNCDISEEITRIGGHLIACEDAMNKVKADAGKKLDFIAQEMQREANTIGAKSGDIRISKSVIEVKAEIEKMREQVKNIE
ncbi:MAG: YicC/YloC family endoribonuclease [Candidatus Omnitrophota bacterium]|nr:YicC/YloC family endoribonuclease [Candidatus Omnitrophota bacterium]